MNMTDTTTSEITTASSTTVVPETTTGTLVDASTAGNIASTKIVMETTTQSIQTTSNFFTNDATTAISNATTVNTTVAIPRTSTAALSTSLTSHTSLITTNLPPNETTVPPTTAFELNTTVTGATTPMSDATTAVTDDTTTSITTEETTAKMTVTTDKVPLSTNPITMAQSSTSSNTHGNWFLDQRFDFISFWFGALAVILLILVLFLLYLAYKRFCKRPRNRGDEESHEQNDNAARVETREFKMVEMNSRKKAVAQANGITVLGKSVSFKLKRASEYSIDSDQDNDEETLNRVLETNNKNPKVDGIENSNELKQRDNGDIPEAESSKIGKVVTKTDKHGKDSIKTEDHENNSENVSEKSTDAIKHESGASKNGTIEVEDKKEEKNFLEDSTKLYGSEKDTAHVIEDPMRTDQPKKTKEEETSSTGKQEVTKEVVTKKSAKNGEEQETCSGDDLMDSDQHEQNSITLTEDRLSVVSEADESLGDQVGHMESGNIKSIGLGWQADAILIDPDSGDESKNGKYENKTDSDVVGKNDSSLSSSGSGNSSRKSSTSSEEYVLDTKINNEEEDVLHAMLEIDCKVESSVKEVEHVELKAEAGTKTEESKENTSSDKIKVAIKRKEPKAPGIKDRIARMLAVKKEEEDAKEKERKRNEKEAAELKERNYEKLQEKIRGIVVKYEGGEVGGEVSNKDDDAALGSAEKNDPPSKVETVKSTVDMDKNKVIVEEALKNNRKKEKIKKK